ncbi:MAG TPA: hypothetical protein VHB20_14555 [Verrucomicrobiae bacterium]|nr:hypothetical protein [Verrucomicrobiae bacterium]
MIPPDSRDIIAAHVIDTLPKDDVKRKQLLVAIGNIIGPEHPSVRTVKGLLSAMEAVDKFQLMLSQEFHAAIAYPTEPAFTPDYDGRKGKRS